MKNTFIAAMFVFWGFIIAVVSAGYIVKQNRIAQESMQKVYLESIQQVTAILAQGNPGVVVPTSVTTSKTSVAVKPTTTNTGTTPKPVTTTTPVVTPTPTPTPTTTPKPTGLTLDTVATHNVQSDCWVVINGKVYSVASYIPMHPGGAKKIINVCGADATSLFTGTGGKGSHKHSSYAQSLLGSYLVGSLQ